jgi:chromate reductase, NAD(P)H dehydrogenase (quinone)
MEHRDFRILGLAGSLRRASFHRGILRAAHEVAPQWMSCESFDLGRIPYFNQDIEDEGNPEPVKELREKIRAYDAVLIATPEYDYAIPGVLTAALDWALRSRYDPTPFRHKPVGIVGASPGSGGTARGQMVLRQILLHPPAYVMPEPQMLIPFSRQKFDAQTGDLVDEETRERLRRFLSALAEWTQQLEKPMEAHQRQANVNARIRSTHSPRVHQPGGSDKRGGRAHEPETFPYGCGLTHEPHPAQQRYHTPPGEGDKPPGSRRPPLRGITEPPLPGALAPDRGHPAPSL